MVYVPALMVESSYDAVSAMPASCATYIFHHHIQYILEILDNQTASFCVFEHLQSSRPVMLFLLWLPPMLLISFITLSNTYLKY